MRLPVTSLWVSSRMASLGYILQSPPRLYSKRKKKMSVAAEGSREEGRGCRGAMLSSCVFWTHTNMCCRFLRTKQNTFCLACHLTHSITNGQQNTSHSQNEEVTIWFFIIRSFFFIRWKFLGVASQILQTFYWN